MSKKRTELAMTKEGLQTLFVGTYKTNKLQIPKVVSASKKLIPNLDDKMATLIAIHEAGTLVSSLNNKIKLNGVTKVTSNIYSLFFAGSGKSKDRSVNTIRAVYSGAYDYIRGKQEKLIISKAKKDAEKATGKASNYKKFMWSIPSTFPSISTEEGAIGLMSKLEQIQLGSFNLGVSELGSEIKTSKDFTGFMKTMAVGYDKGTIPAKIVKTVDLQVDDVSGININALMFSSMHTLRADKTTKDKFQDLMTIQFARRTIFYVNLQTDKVEHDESIGEFLSSSRTKDKEFEKVASVLSNHMTKMVKGLPTNSNIQLSDKPDKHGFSARDLFNIYEKYCELKGQDISAKYEMYSLAVTHAFWRALKLSSLFTMLRGSTTIEVNDFIQAVSVVESYTAYLKEFQAELDKEPYELFVDWCRSRGKVGKGMKVTRHEVTKQKAIAGVITDQKLTDLVNLCNSYDKEGTFLLKGKHIVYTKLPPAKDKKAVDIPNIEEEVETVKKKTSVKVKGTKKKVPTTQLIEAKANIKVVGSFAMYPKFTAGNAKFKVFSKTKSNKGYEPYEGDFSKYAEALTSNCLFSPYRFKGGNRLMDNIIDPSNVIVLDVDDTVMDIESMHLVLSDVTHIIATTSDPENKYKYRIVIALDRDIELNSIEWRKFYRSIADTLGIPVDTNINKAGYFVGYKDSEIYTCYNGGLLSTQKHLIKAQQKEEEPQQLRKLKSQKEMDIAWDDREELFEFAYMAEKHRSLILYTAMRQALKMGFTAQMVKDLLTEIAEDMLRPFPLKRLKTEVLSQLHKFV